MDPRWELTSATSETPRADLRGGIYNFVLTVTDTQDLSHSVDFNVTVNVKIGSLLCAYSYESEDRLPTEIEITPDQPEGHGVVYIKIPLGQTYSSYEAAVKALGQPVASYDANQQYALRSPLSLSLARSAFRPAAL